MQMQMQILTVTLENYQKSALKHFTEKNYYIWFQEFVYIQHFVHDCSPRVFVFN